MAQTLLWFGFPFALAAFFTIPLITRVKDLNVPQIPGEKERCPVCGMLVSPHLDWTAQVRHGDGRTVFFDGCKDLFKYLLSLDRYGPKKRRSSVAAVFVTNYYDGEIIAARTTLFVVGSNALGPMGHELVPHQSYAAAEYFMRDHDGRRILRFDEVTEAILHELM